MRGKRTGLIAAALLATFPTQIYWGAQARMHSLGLALTATATLLLVRALRAEPARRALWASYGVAAASMLYAHYFTMFTLAAHGAVVIGVSVTRSTIPRNAWAALVAAGVMFLPWLPVFLKQRAQVASSWWAAPLDFWNAGSMWYGCWVPRWWMWQPEDPPTRPTILLVTALSAALLAVVWRLGPVGRGAVVTATLPFALGALASALGSRVMNGPYLLFMQLSIAGAAAMAITALPGRLWPAVASVAVCAVLARHSLTFSERVRAYAPDYAVLERRIVELSAAAQEPVVIDAFDYYTLLYYAKDHRQWRVYGAYEGRVVHFNGGALVTGDDRVIGSEELDQLATRGPLWIVQNGSGAGSRRVPAPTRATRVRGERFRACDLAEYTPLPNSN